ncbi:SUMF1/EgtB/PvdO family nonheme iron enzyme [Motilimonas sp. 1_MG-2023]|uniref:formylglycine-generating enzyme family protein n=1 Tax=Motilimonas sp. 1_MG-2023 TaxID=3062672 RepID=UPI0026E1C621|nr:SUMF1/EgtB/PvdO family nonheme iron enzyme [Motilimonas sp. 1_MG-2023]MDO6527203.1 SUMF1/EgtB/PvdO family nonheme iron enzyme [Motilimonas sp. 1_MG-2023]
MRIAPLVLSAGIFSLGMAAFPLYASQVSELDNKIQTKQAEFDAYVNGLEQIRSSIKQDKDELERLIKLNDTLEDKRKSALLDMDKQYERLVADPSLDISASIEAYQYALQAQNLNKTKVKAQKTLLATNQDKLANSKMTQFSMLNEIENLKERYNFARVERIKREFSQGGKMEVSQSIACGEDVTFKQCAEQGNDLAKKTASQMLTNKLFQNVTEQALVAKHRDTAAAGIKIVSEKVLDSGFSGQGDYSVKMLVEMQGRLPQAQACRLLSLDYRYCGVNGETADMGDFEEVEFSSLKNEPGMYTLTVRSDQYNDEVYINGKSYGASRVDAMLPPGEYKITVKKPGFHPYNTSIKLSGARTVRAELSRLVVNLKPGQRFADRHSDGTASPAMVAIAGGRYKVGDLQGRGLGNEQAPNDVNIPTTFAIGQKEVTVAEFEKFVKETGYQTSAEKGRGCAVYDSGAPEYNADLSWRKPGFEQSKKSPVVCVTKDDAVAYSKWLSRNTGYQYRLPTESEWEVSARAGSRTDYWWGNNIGAGNANCGWCGSRWSNNSTSPTGSFKANKFGLHDTVGNVWEITEGSPAVVRGGSWNFAPSLARASSRLEISSSFASNYIGFRVVREQ